MLAAGWVAACGGRASGSGAAAGSVAAPGSPSQAIAVPEAGKLYHGALPAGADPHATDFGTDISAAALDGYEQAVNRKVAWVYFSNEWKDSRAFPAETVRWIRGRGALPFVRLMLRSQKEALAIEPTFTLPRLLAGEFDADLARWADGAKASGGPIVVEYGTEVNGDWNPWSAPYNGGLDKGPARFVEAFRHVVALMRSRGATNITWALHYNVQGYPEDPRNVPASYYPGDDFVDWVGVSAYGSERSTDHRCPTFRALLDEMIPQLRAATSTRPLFVFEFGITNTNQACPPAPWVQEALADLLSGRWPDVRGFSWWQQRWNDDGAAGSNMMVQDDPGVTAAFRKALVGAANLLDTPLFR